MGRLAESPVQFSQLEQCQCERHDAFAPRSQELAPVALYKCCKHFFKGSKTRGNYTSYGEFSNSLFTFTLETGLI